jgi:hypothetical protein
LILDFYGMKIIDKKTGELGRTENFEERYEHAILKSWHNHLRIRRILACLSVTGFRIYAENLAKHLFSEIYGFEDKKLQPKLANLAKADVYYD